MGISESRLTSLGISKKDNTKTSNNDDSKNGQNPGTTNTGSNASHRHNLFESPESSIEVLYKKDGKDTDAWHSRQMASFLHTQMMLGIGLWDIARAYERNKLSITAHSVAGQYSPTVTAITFEPKKWKLWYVVDGGPVGAWDISAIPATNRNISTLYVGLISSPNISSNIAISPNNDLLARIKDDIQFWSLPNFAQLYNFRNEDTLSFAISQNIFARSGANCEIRICNLINGEVRDTLTGHTKRILSMDFSPDGELLVTGSEDNTVRVWDVAAKKQIAVMYGHSEKVLDVIYLPFSDRKLVASGSNDCTVRIWDYGFEK